jgi:hypothetical protein
MSEGQRRKEREGKGDEEREGSRKRGGGKEGREWDTHVFATQN